MPWLSGANVERAVEWNLSSKSSCLAQSIDTAIAEALQAGAGKTLWGKTVLQHLPLLEARGALVCRFVEYFTATAFLFTKFAASRQSH
jgi:hypothetical protein